MPLRLFALLLAALFGFSAIAGPAPAAAQPRCTFTLGFRALHDLIPGIVGECLENEWHKPDDGNTLQRTTGGLLVWRKADNWTAFTDGATTWINGPFGLQSRPNEGPLFAWESPPDRPRTILVYFSRQPESDSDFTFVVPVQRSAPGPAVAEAALGQLIDGPTPEERAVGLYSELGGMLRGPSSCGGRDFALTIASGLATVRFCREVVSAGIGQDARTRTQIERTLGQFPTVQRVRLLTADGNCLFDPSGLNRCLMIEPRESTS